MAIDLTLRSEKSEPITLAEHDQNLTDIQTLVNQNETDISALDGRLTTGENDIDDLEADMATAQGDIIDNATAIALNTAHRNSTSGNPHSVGRADLSLSNIINGTTGVDITGNSTVTGDLDVSADVSADTLTIATSGTIAGSAILTTADEGSGNGIDADTLDGMHESSFVRTDETSTIGSDKQLIIGNGPGSLRISYSSSGDVSTITPYGVSDWRWDRQISYDADSGYWDFEGSPRADDAVILTEDTANVVKTNANNVFTVSTQTIEATGPKLKLNETDTTTTSQIVVTEGKLRIEAGLTGSGDTASGGDVQISGHSGTSLNSFQVREGGAWNDIWHEGNDGSGSGLDADKLDGYEATAFQRPALTTTDSYAIQATGNWDDYKTTGFYRGTGMSNMTPFRTHAWQYTQVIQHNSSYCVQLALGYETGAILSYRIYNQAVWGSWHEVWSDVNDGSGSGLDADTLDGVEGSSYLRSDTDNIIATGKNFIIGSGEGHLKFYHNSTGNVIQITPYDGAAYATDKQIEYDADTGSWNIEGSPRADGNRILTTADEGSGNGLDADTLDGYEASNFTKTSFTAPLNANDSPVGVFPTGNSSSQLGDGSSNYPSTHGTLHTNYQSTYRCYQMFCQNSDPNELYFRQWYNGAWTSWVQMWHAGNDGSGSGLDADTVDSLHASSFLRADTDDSYSSDKSLTIGSGEGAVRIRHSSSDNRFWMAPYDGGAFDYTKEITFDADVGEWNIEGDPLAGGNRIITTGDPIGRNAIINGDFQQWQRGTSFTASGYTSDRFKLSLIGDSSTVSQQTFSVGQTYVPGNPIYYLRSNNTLSSGAGNATILLQHIEDVRRFAGETVTLSLYARAGSGTPNIAVELYQSFGSGGSSTVTGIGVNKFAISTTLTRYDFQIDVPSISGKTVGTGSSLVLAIWQSAGSDFNSRTDSLGQQSIQLDIADVQLESGSDATPFERKTYDHNLRECMRYFQTVHYMMSLAVTNAVIYYQDYNFPVPQRASGTISISSTGTTNMGVATDEGGDATFRRVKSTASATGNGLSYGTFTSDADF